MNNLFRQHWRGLSFAGVALSGTTLAAGPITTATVAAAMTAYYFATRALRNAERPGATLASGTPKGHQPARVLRRG